jgi:hypothetical protein
VKSMWLKCLIFCLCPKLNFPSRRQFSQDILLRFMEKTNEFYVLLSLAKCYSTTTNFDLWMSEGTNDVFTLAIKF